jgi:lipoprotein signal peptidase
MPARSFIGIGILIGLIAGAWVGIHYGGVPFCLIAGVIVGGGIGWAVDRLVPDRRAD